MLFAPHTTHRGLHVLRASLCQQYCKMHRRYQVEKQLYFKGVCLGLHQSIKEIDALLDDGPTDLAADRDWADARENTLAGRDSGDDACARQDGSHTRPARRVGAWGQLIGIVLVGAVVLAGWAWRVGE